MVRLAVVGPLRYKGTNLLGGLKRDVFLLNVISLQAHGNLHLISLFHEIPYDARSIVKIRIHLISGLGSIGLGYYGATAERACWNGNRSAQIAVALLSGTAAFFILLKVLSGSCLLETGFQTLIRFVDEIFVTLVQTNSLPLMICSGIILIGITTTVTSLLPKE